MTTTQKIHKAFNSFLKPVTVENEYKPLPRIKKTITPPEMLSYNDTMIYIHNAVRSTQLPKI